MKKIVFAIGFIWLIVPACNNSGHNKDAESDLDAARNFIQYSLKGDFNNASQYMLHDSINDGKFNAVARLPRTPEEKQGLWDASINIHNRNPVNDSTSFIVYSNSYYKNNMDTLKVVKEKGKWLVDFKYLFDHD